MLAHAQETTTCLPMALVVAHNTHGLFIHIHVHVVLLALLQAPQTLVCNSTEGSKCEMR